MKRIESFKDAWTLPFKKDAGGYCCYVWDSRNHMCFDFMIENTELYDRVIKLLNKEDAEPFEKAFCSESDMIVVNNDFGGETGDYIPIMFVRGWGYLTGCGGLNLDAKTATSLQKELIAYCTKRLKGEE